ncbi:MAG: hypothetical protein HC836_15700 [Richelia sp. RM2_1_2]|nr:hypothetical protein [Richelia sp. RM2_1_2]
MDINKSEIRKIVQDELASILNKELDKKIADLLKKKNSKTSTAATDISKDSLDALYRFMYLRRNIWKKDL